VGRRIGLYITRFKNKIEIKWEFSNISKKIK
jgi:hypothetical protein